MRSTRTRVGAQWLERMGWTNDRAMAVRDSWADESARVTDIHFDDAVADPIGQVSRLYDELGLSLTDSAVAAMTDWLAHRPREVPRPRYDPGRLRPDRCTSKRTIFVV